MKRFILYTLAVVIVACTACDKFLDEDPTDRIPDNEAYNTEGDLYRNAMASLYGYVGGNLTVAQINPMFTFHDVSGRQIIDGIAGEFINRMKEERDYGK